MKLIRKLILLIAIFIIVTQIVSADSIDKSIKVFYNVAKRIVIDGNDRTPSQNKPFVYEGTTYVPLRYVSEQLGKEVKWDGETGTIYIGAMPEHVVYLTDIKPYNITDFETYHENLYSIDEEMIMGNKKFMKGLQLQASGYSYKSVYYNLDGQYSKISGLVGLDDSDNGFKFNDPVIVNFYLDDEKIDTVKFVQGDLPKKVELDVNGGLQFRIDIGCEANNHPLVNFVNMTIE